MKNTNHVGENKVRIGNTTFVVRSHFTHTTGESAEQLILKLMESKIQNKQNEREEQIA